LNKSDMKMMLMFMMVLAVTYLDHSKKIWM